MDTTLAIVMAIVVAILVAVIVATLLQSNANTLQNFFTNNVNFTG